MKVLGAHLLCLLVAFVVLSDLAQSVDPDPVTPNWEYVKSCMINVTEDLGDGKKRERSYCCDGWRSKVTTSGQLQACTEWDSGTNNSAGLSTLAEWKKVAEDVNKIHDNMKPLLLSGKSLSVLQEEIERNLSVVLYLEGKVNESEVKLKELEIALEQFRLGKSGYISEPADSPCSKATCTNHPEAVCMVISKCRRDYAVFWDPNTYIPIEDCETTDEQCIPQTLECDQSRCNGLACPSLANATCVVEEECCVVLWQMEGGEVVECPDGELLQDGRRKRSMC